MSTFLHDQPTEPVPADSGFQPQPTTIGGTDFTISNDGVIIPFRPTATDIAQRKSNDDPYDTIYSRLDEVRRNDKRKWHHRPIYRVNYSRLCSHPHIHLANFIGFVARVDALPCLQQCKFSKDGVTTSICSSVQFQDAY